MTSPYERLASAEGSALLEKIAGFTEARAAAAAAAARASADQALAAAALATAFARRRAAAAHKFTRAGEMLFTREGYEQASSEAVARHRGARFRAHKRVADLCCGIGSDAVGIASSMTSGEVEGIDHDADVVACARRNAAVYGVAERTSFREGDALQKPLGACDAAFADPSRRREGDRTASASEYQPPLDGLLARARELPGHSLAVKIAPGLRVREESLQQACGASVELEYVSERGVCKEAVVWCGDLARFAGARRATVIAADGVHMLDAAPSAQAPVAALGRWLGEPDPAVIRSGLIGAMCGRTGAAVLDRLVAYCTADRPTPSPFVRWFEVIAALPFGVKRLRAWLREAHVGDLVIKTRAFPLRPEQIALLLRARGDARAVLVCTTIAGAKTAILCRAPAPPLPT